MLRLHCRRSLQKTHVRINSFFSACRFIHDFNGNFQHFLLMLNGGATTLGIMTLSIMAFTVMILNIEVFCDTKHK
jgi:hypothetical protein